ncbi:MAG: hypothetical protein LBD11_08185 [Candidatus Peribacteria bacterium]|jgi:hypothetical protein|nr:hypothetical protein [Candidatus Peribacteria bacterium]
MNHKIQRTTKKKGLTLGILGLIFLLFWGSLYLRKGINDEGSLTLGIVLVVMGVLFFFIKGKKADITDEMVRKIHTLAMTSTLRVWVLLTAVLYFINTRRREFSVNANVLLGGFLYGTLILQFFFLWRYKKHAEKLPF